MLTNATIGTKSQNQFFSKQQDMETKNSSFLKITVMLSVLADGREITTLVMVKRKEFSNKNYLVELHIFKCNETCWMTEELMAEWPREVWQRITASLLKER